MRNRGRFGRFCAAILAVVVAHAAVAAEWAADAGVERLRFRRLGVREGLSQSIATSLAQDPQGFVWIGTQDGLNRYDGYGFRVYKHDRNDAASLPDNNVRRLLVDTKGRLWVGLQSGVARYDAQLDRFERWRLESGTNALAARSVSALFEDRDAQLWVASAAGGVQRFDETAGGFRRLPCDGEPVAHVTALAQARDGALLLGTDRGLWRCDTASGVLTEWRHGGERIAAGTQAIRVGADGEVWVVAAGQGVFRFDADGAAGLRLDRDAVPPLADRTVRGLLVDRDGKVWFGSDVRGVSRFDPATRALESYGHEAGREYSLASNRAFSLLQDRAGMIWIGSWGSGVSLLDPRTAAFVQLHPGGGAHALPGASATAVLADGDGAFWVGTLENGGLSRFEPARGVTEHHTHDPQRPDSLAANFVTSLARGHDGSLWVGTNDAGVDRRRPGATGFEHYRHDPARADSLSNDAVQGLYVDRAGTLWVSTESGLNALCAGCDRFRRYLHDPADPASLGGASVQNVVERRSGEFWVALRRNGLDRLDRETGRAEHYRADAQDPRSLGGDVVTALHEDARGELWIGTQGGGVSRLQRDGAGVRFEALTTRQGLAADAIGGIAEDAQGRLWLSTTAGISRYDPSTRSVLNLSGATGGADSGYFIGAASQGADGRVLFGGPTGVTVFDPADATSAPPPQPVFTDFRLFNAAVPLRWRDASSPLARAPWSGGAIELDHRQSMFSLDFAAPNAADPEAVRYAYRLEPHDAAWIETDATRRTATYTRLPPGDYRLRLRARFAGDAWNGSEAVLAVHVEPAPWLGWPARATYFFVAAALAWWWWRRRRELARGREAAQEVLRASEERLKHALWGSGGELWDIDLVSGSLHRENRLEHLAASHDAKSQHVDSYAPFVHPDDTVPLRDALIVHLKGRTDDFVVSYRTRDRGGDWAWVLTRGRVVARDATNGRALRMTGTTHDINALKRAEAALRDLNEELELRVERRTSALRTANVELQQTLDRLTATQRQLLEAEKLASLGGLVAGIAHEINTPLGVGVTAASHLVEETRRLGRLLDDGAMTRSDLDGFRRTARESSDLILRNLKRAGDLVKSFKQVAVDQSNEERRVVELGACMREVVTTLGPALKKTPHSIAIACPVPVTCSTAPGALYQILTNLVMNSLTHGFTSGAPGAIVVAVSRDGDEAVIDYRDDGVGMDEPTRVRVFDPFFTTRRGQGGSGLGMHIAYNLVTQVLGGTIACRSSPGNGVQFRIRFPLGAAP